MNIRVVTMIPSIRRQLCVAALALVSIPALAGPDVPSPPEDVKPIRVSGLGIRVSDLERSKQFYTEVLGLKVAARVPAQGEAHEYCSA
ncbi:VOC family protein [Steroidobacter agaridevorans]|uniref:VOC family protein n=1 Tax=Steroidobacter agaridevorans TaxID=2695856 RepID=UPI001324339C|nr:VOC family protein [Steroidobacter agaridevorans]GFE85243.1 hypothetical protein GCM10011488_01970 [Steroidobacter agaridevorans]